MNKPKPIKSRYKTEAGYQKALNAWKKEQTALKKKMLEGNSFQDKEKATKKSAAKKPAAKKPVAKRKPFDPPKRGRGRPKGSKNIPKRKPFDSVDKSQQPTPKGNKSLRIKERFNKLVDKGKEFKSKVTPKDQTPQQAIPEGKSKGAKFAKKVNQAFKSYTDQVVQKGQADAKKFKKNWNDPSKKNINRSGVKRGTGAGAALLIGNALVNRLTKPKGMSHKEWDDFKAKQEQKGQEKTRKLIKKGYDFYGKRLKKVSSDLTGKKEESSTTKNINKQKTSNNNKLKVSNVSQRDKDLREAKRRVKKAKGYNKEKLQREVRYQEKFGKQGRTWSNPVGAKGKGKPSSVKTDTKSKPKKMHAIEKRNRERFGDAHVDRLKAKHAEWKKRRKKKK